MIAGIIIEAIAKIASGVVNGIFTAQAVDTQIEEYNKAAQEVAEATEKTSGRALKKAMTNAGTRFAVKNASQRLGMAASKVAPEGVRKMANLSNNANDFVEDFSQASNRVKMLKDAEYNKATARAQNLTAQADKQYGANIATGQAVTGGLSSIADIGKEFIRSEKE